MLTFIQSILRKTLKPTAPWLAAVFLIGFLFGCGENPKANDPFKDRPHAGENTLYYDVSAPFDTLDPAAVDASGSTHITPLLYSFLCVPDQSGKLQPDLATQWSYDPATFTFTIQLRSDARFHNGLPVTAADVKFSLLNWLKKRGGNLLEDLEKIDIGSPSSLTLHLNKDTPSFLHSVWDFEILCREGYQSRDHFTQPVGSGPFRFLSRQGQDKVVLEANPEYYLGRPAVDQIVYTHVADKMLSWKRLLTGETDIALDLSLQNYEMMHQYQKRFYFDEYTLWYYSILLYNTHDPLFADPNVRRALTLAIDRDEIVKTIFNGYARVAAGPMGLDSPYHDPQITPLPFDPEQALALLQKAGWHFDPEGLVLQKQGKPFRFTAYITKANPIDAKIAQFIKICLADIGVQVRLEALPTDELIQKYHAKTDFQVVLAELRSGNRGAERIIQELFMSDLNQKAVAGCFKDDALNSLLNKLPKMTNQVQARQLMYRIEQRLVQLQPGTFLIQKSNFDAMSKRFRIPLPFRMGCDGVYRLQFAVLGQV